MSHEPSPNHNLPDQLKKWETPELIIEDVAAVTHGGDEGDIVPEDDAFYS